ncbi:MAG: hypothetical protein AB7V46_13670 [Thermomicrobiales bacterium]
MIELAVGGWSAVVSALDGTRPIVTGEMVHDWPADLLPKLVTRGVLVEGAPSASLACRECPESPYCDVVHAESWTGRVRALLRCPHCGPCEIPLDWLRRWHVDSVALMHMLAESLGLKQCPNEVSAGHLWRSGRIHRNGTNWSLWWGIRLARQDAVEMLQTVKFSPRTLLVVPGRRPRTRFPDGVVVGSLRELTTWDDDGLHWDQELLDELLRVEITMPSLQGKAAPRRRQSRASDIEALTQELKQHLRSARDYAFHTRDTQGIPKLLPRPTQKELAQRLGITESRVSRSLNDTAAQQLQLLWELAEDVDRIMRFG